MNVASKSWASLILRFDFINPLSDGWSKNHRRLLSMTSRRMPNTHANSPWALPAYALPPAAERRRATAVNQMLSSQGFDEDLSGKREQRALNVAAALVVLLVLALYVVIPLLKRLPSCYDGVHNGDEFGIDCGGHCAAPALVVTMESRMVTKRGSIAAGCAAQHVPPVVTG